MKKATFDLLKIGMFFLGVSTLIFASIALHAYLKSLSEDSYSNPFYAYCQQGMIIIQANKDLENISVYDAKQNLLCNFDKILKNSEELYDVSNVNSTIFVIQNSLSKKVVRCYEPNVRPLIQ